MTLTFFSMLFWAFAQQGGSSISLYIDRFVNRDMFGYTVPTAMFHRIIVTDYVVMVFLVVIKTYA